MQWAGRWVSRVVICYKQKCGGRCSCGCRFNLITGLMGGQCHDAVREYGDKVCRWEELGKFREEEAEDHCAVKNVIGVQRARICVWIVVSTSVSWWSNCKR